MEPSPTLPPGVAALARSMGLGQLADQAQAVLDSLPAEALPAVDAPEYQLTELHLLRDEVKQLRDELAPLVALAAQLGPLLQLPKVQRALAKQQG